MDAHNLNWKGRRWQSGSRYEWFVRSAVAEVQAKRRWSLRTAMMVAYSLFVIGPVVLLGVALAAVLAGLIMLGNALFHSSPPFLHEARSLTSLPRFSRGSIGSAPCLVDGSTQRK